MAVIDERTRTAAQRVATHVLSRERKTRSGRIGLWWTGDGIGTDALWLDGKGVLHRAVDGATHHLTTLDAAARFAAVDLDEPLDVGHDTPLVGDTSAPLSIQPDALAELVGFYRRAFAQLEPIADGEVITLWPEHFDAAFVWRGRANVGASPGDEHSAAPYFYVGPWGPERPGGQALWDAPFGATIEGSADDGAVLAFLRSRLDALGALDA